MRSKTILTVIVITAVIFSVIGLAVTATDKTNDETYSIITDGEGKFYELKNTGGNAVLKCYSGSGENGNMLINNFRAEYCLTSKGKTVMVGNSGKTLTVIKYPQGHNITSYIENVELKEKCIAMSKDMCIYLVDKKDRNSVKKYDKLIYEDDTIDTGSAINYLFTENISGKVFAAASDGIFDTQERRFIKCPVPEYPIKSNAGYYSDRKGVIYKFSENSGFEKITSIKSSSICTLEDHLLYKDGRKIILSSYSGEITGSYTCHSDIDDIYASGNMIAWTHNNSINFISKNNFTRSNEEESHISEPVSVDNSTDSSKEISHQNNSTAASIPINTPSLYSDTYNIGNNTITGIPQKTKAAAFLKNINSDTEIILKDNNGNHTETGYIATGWSLEFSGSQKSKKYDIIIKGDVNGDGIVDANDIKEVFGYIDNTEGLNKVKVLAADCNDDGIIDTIDLFMIQSISKNIGKYY